MPSLLHGGQLANRKKNEIPFSEIKSEDGADELVRSERMKPYLAMLVAQIGGQDIEPHLATLTKLPLEDRYVWRVVSALKWAFCDLETESVIADRNTMSAEDFKKIVEPLELRAMQFCMFLNSLLGENTTEQIMQRAIRVAKEASMADSEE